MPDDLRDQFPKVREVVKALRIPVLELAGFEADDVIGTLTVEAEALGLDTTIVTGDLDMLQLVTDRTRLMTTRMGVQNTIIYDPAKILERYGLRPAQMIDFKALKGDSYRQHPGRARGWREDRGQADRRLRQPRRPVRAHRRGRPARLREPAPRGQGPGPDGPRADARSCATCRSSSTSTRRDWATTTGRP